VVEWHTQRTQNPPPKGMWVRIPPRSLTGVLRSSQTALRRLGSRACVNLGDKVSRVPLLLRRLKLQYLTSRCIDNPSLSSVRHHVSTSRNMIILPTTQTADVRMPTTSYVNPHAPQIDYACWECEDLRWKDYPERKSLCWMCGKEGAPLQKISDYKAVQGNWVGR
jgi:hypothetical protein